MLVEQVCVKILKTHGEAIRRELLKENLLDIKLKIKQEGGFLHIPTHPLPRSVEIRLQEQFEVIFETCKFDQARQQPKTILEYLEEKFPGEDFSNIPQGFDRIGDIVVVEIKEPLQFFEKEIGAAILEGTPSITAVYAKDGKIQGTYRLQQLRCIAGQEKQKTIHQEYGVQLSIEIGKVYFSPRLAQEHHRIATQVNPNECVLDMFTGIGPFPIHIAKRVEGTIYAIDINPKAIACLKDSMTRNKLLGKIIPLQGDTRIITKKSLQGICDRVLMNLPGSADKYIPTAVSALKPSGGIIHFYTFEREPAIEDKAQKLLSKKVKETGAAIHKIISHQIKDIAPNTTQMVVDAFIQPKDHSRPK